MNSRARLPLRLRHRDCPVASEPGGHTDAPSDAAPTPSAFVCGSLAVVLCDVHSQKTFLSFSLCPDCPLVPEATTSLERTVTCRPELISQHHRERSRSPVLNMREGDEGARANLHSRGRVREARDSHLPSELEACFPTEENTPTTSALPRNQLGCSSANPHAARHGRARTHGTVCLPVSSDLPLCPFREPVAQSKYSPPDTPLKVRLLRGAFQSHVDRKQGDRVASPTRRCLG